MALDVFEPATLADAFLATKSEASKSPEPATLYSASWVLPLRMAVPEPATDALVKLAVTLFSFMSPEPATDTWRSLQVMLLLLMSPEPAMEISRSVQEMLFPLMSPEPATEILMSSVFSPFFQFHVSRTCHGNAVQLFCGHTYFQFIIGYADVLLEADVEGIVLDTDIQ